MPDPGLQECASDVRVRPHRSGTAEVPNGGAGIRRGAELRTERLDDPRIRLEGCGLGKPHH